MLHKEANRLARQLVQQTNFDDAPGSRDRASPLMHDAVLGEARIFLANDATGAVATRRGADGILVATDDRALYAIEGVLPENEMSPGRARCRLISIDQDRDTVEHEVTYQRLRGSLVRETTWRFSVRDLSFEIATQFGEEDGLPPEEQFAQRLAAAIGGSFGGRVQGLQRVA